MLNGVINLNKPANKTSHDMIYFMRRMAGQKRVGHTGTLDPDAKGVLPICLGIATKASNYITGGKKGYRAHIHFGKTTTTQDLSGDIISECETLDFDETEFSEALKKFTGEIQQIPPMYSAVKVNGKKLYEFARKGIEVERKKRNITIYSIEINEINLKEKYAVIDVVCSKGTYIRTLCYDIGEMLGCGACMGELVRTQSGRFTIDKSYTVEEIEQLSKENRLDEILIPTDILFDDYKKLNVSGKNEFKVKNGSPLENFDFPENTLFRIYDINDNFLCISQMLDGKIKMLTSFWSVNN